MVLVLWSSLNHTIKGRGPIKKSNWVTPAYLGCFICCVSLVSAAWADGHVSSRGKWCGGMDSVSPGSSHYKCWLKPHRGVVRAFAGLRISVVHVYLGASHFTCARPLWRSHPGARGCHHLGDRFGICVFNRHHRNPCYLWSIHLWPHCSKGWSFCRFKFSSFLVILYSHHSHWNVLAIESLKEYLPWQNVPKWIQPVFLLDFPKSW